MVFRSFDDYKPAVYFYVVLPFVKLLGLNIWAVRLPSAILGTLSVYLVYLIVKILVGRHRESQSAEAISASGIASSITPRNDGINLALISALLLATSPWHLQFSRGGWEVNVSTFFILLGVFGFLKGLENSKYFFLFVISMVLSLYTYHSSRLIAPLVSLSLVVLYWNKLFVIPAQAGIHKVSTFLSVNKTVLLSAVLGIILVLPLASQMLSKEGQSRFTGVSVFSDSGPLWQALESRREHPAGLYTRLIHNQYLSYGLRFTRNYLSHFSPRFLFISGDEIARSKVPGMGQSLLFLIPFYFLGLFNLLKLDFKWKKFVLFWFLVSPVAAAMTFQSPHALRAQNMAIPLSIITALGISEFFIFISTYKFVYKTLIFCVFGFLSFYSVSQYLHQYYIHYAKELPYAWQYGFDQIAAYTKENYNKYDKIIISDRYDQPYILMAFFLQYPPETLQKELVMTPRDKFGFSTVRKMGKYEFRSVNYGEDKKSPNTLIVSTDESVDENMIIYSIKDLSGNIMYKFISTNAK
jgi:4-amino-4-deoxy-L-arabinose transferase-like glycosyltransferase